MIWAFSIIFASLLPQKKLLARDAQQEAYFYHILPPLLASRDQLKGTPIQLYNLLLHYFIVQAKSREQARFFHRLLKFLRRSLLKLQPPSIEVVKP